MAGVDARYATGDVAGDEVRAAAVRLVVEQDAARDEHAVGAPVMYREVVGVHLGGGVGRAGLKKRLLGLRSG